MTQEEFADELNDLICAALEDLEAWRLLRDLQHSIELVQQAQECNDEEVSIA